MAWVWLDPMANCHAHSASAFAKATADGQPGRQALAMEVTEPVQGHRYDSGETPLNVDFFVLVRRWNGQR